MNGKTYVTYVAVSSDGSEWIFGSNIMNKPKRGKKYWVRGNEHIDNMIRLPYGTIKKIIGRELTWNDDAVEINPFSTIK